SSVRTARSTAVIWAFTSTMSGLLLVLIGWVCGGVRGLVCRRGIFFGSEPPRTPAASEFGAERVQPRLPQAAERVEPVARRFQRCRVDRVEPPRALGSGCREPRLPQHA